MATPTVTSGNFEDLERDLEALLREQNSNHNSKSSPFDLDLDDLNMYRSGSAPPTVEGSRTAYNSLFEPRTNLDEEFNGDDEELMRSHPAYLSYYYSNDNINPRLPPPMVSREDWRAAQRCHVAAVGPTTGAQVLGGIGDRRRKQQEFENSNNSTSLFAAQPGIGTDGLMGLPDVGLVGSRRKSFADALQENLSRPTPLPMRSPSRPSSRNSFDTTNLTGFTDFPNPAPLLLTGSDLVNGLQPDSSSASLARVRSLGSSASHSLASGLVGSSLSRSTTPDPQLIRRTPSPCLPPVGVKMNSSDRKTDGGLHEPITPDFGDMKAAISAMSSLSLDKEATRQYLQQKGLHTAGDFTGLNMKSRSGGYASQMLNNPLNPGGLEGDYLNLGRNQVGSSFQSPIDPVYTHYAQSPSESALNAASQSMDPFVARNNYLSSDLPDYQKAYLSAILAQQKLQYGLPFLGKSAGMYGTGGDHSFNLGMPYLASPTYASSQASRARQLERLTRASSMRSYTSETGLMDDGFPASLLEDFKSNKSKSFELMELVGHVVEFSSDQYGSRFIQQKLESATTEEKNKIFPEILPHSRALMTDVFGNYVIQKFFEYGTESQRRQLASQLKGHVLQLSLQMYGCRVIQKALEVVEEEQQGWMVQELDGNIMRCVRDQNGNHVIQKCIERVPQHRIHFIISSFFGHVVELSTHPYGCRVIQRVLEYCDDAETQSIMMEEIMPSVITLAQDQYGNYVIQHVLQQGKPEERSVIIKKLAGQIVKMSQQKFASNVVEKCLTYGTAEERQLLINEMLGTTDENEPLQVMMKDQFANYVVQKVLETCDEQNRELILSRIKVHLNALKRYTYGKHIVARVEKLIAAGERVSASS